MYAIRSYYVLYVSPERLATQIFRTRISDMKVNLVVVDEAHCISQGGYDFRPSYLEISKLREVVITSYSIHYTKLYDRSLCQ